MRRAIEADVLPEIEVRRWAAVLYHDVGEYAEAVREYGRCINLVHRGWGDVYGPELKRLQYAAKRRRPLRQVDGLTFEGTVFTLRS